MHAIIKSSCLIGLSLILSGIGMNSARANFGLQEDFSGANVWNSPAPTFVGADSPISPEIINTARQLSQELENAYISSDAQGLDRAIQETKDFLNSLNREQAEQLRRSRALRIW
ncbi:MAG: hypothetical protein AB4352_27155 [Hormoscilla sp.]